MTSHDAEESTREAVAALRTSVQRLQAAQGDTLGVRRLVSDVDRLAADLDELGPPAPGHPRGPAREDLEEIPDTPYDESMWADAEHEGFGAPDRRAP
ncbi:MAG: hypothetical protein H0V49_01635 [Nocardioidaceae bacterium]|nr:hypothetical protein [Nocardioidaceae bacterium]